MRAAGDCRKRRVRRTFERMTTALSPSRSSSSKNAALDLRALLGRIVATDGDKGAALARLALGVVMFPHGAQKVLGWFGGYGFSGTLGFFTSKMGIPAPLAVLAMLTELLGALALISGAVARVAALGIAVVMVTAVALVHLPNGFFMNWYGTAPGEGFEYHLLAIGLAAVVLVKGAGAWSIDGKLARR